MCLVIYLSYVVSKYLAHSSVSMGTSKYMSIIDRVPLGKDRFLLIVKIGEKLFFVGVTDQGIQQLSQIEAADLIEQIKPPQFNAQTFKQLLQKKLKSNDEQGQAPHD